MSGLSGSYTSEQICACGVVLVIAVQLNAASVVRQIPPPGDPKRIVLGERGSPEATETRPGTPNGPAPPQLNPVEVNCAAAQLAGTTRSSAMQCRRTRISGW